MKKASFVCFLFAIIFSGCESSNQLQGFYMGSMLGGVFGSSIGGVVGGFRGSDAGAALGMLIGGAAGVAATAPKHDSSAEMQSQVDEVDEYNRRSTSRKSTAQVNVPEEFRYLEIENLRFVDRDNNHCINADERCQLTFEIHNVGNNPAYNVAPIITISGTKHILVSPTAIVSRIGAGRSVRYTAEIYGKPRLRRGTADFEIGFAYGNSGIYTVRSFQLQTQE